MQDKDFGKSILEGLHYLPEERIFLTEVSGENYIIEAFDEPLVAQMVIKNSNDDWKIEFPYGIQKKLLLDQLSIDEWDRFHGVVENNLPFVFSRKAQNAFFNLVDEFSDDGFTIGGKFFATPPYWQTQALERKSSTWSERYAQGQHRWDMGGENPILNSAVPQLKIPKSRILVLGCGKGHDANYFAKLGHVVTAVDFSELAIQEAKKLYGQKENLRFVCADAFNLPEEFQNQFDIIFEHTLYCAIDPTQRNNLVKVYKNCLNEHGHLLAIFLTIENKMGPPFGCTEWEYRQRLKKHFQFLYWTRWRDQTQRESKRSFGSELIVYAKKL